MRKLGLVAVLALSSLTYANAVEADMAAPAPSAKLAASRNRAAYRPTYSIPVTTLLVASPKAQGKREALAAVAAAIGVTTITSTSQSSEGVTDEEIAGGFRAAMEAHPAWDVPMDRAKVGLVTKHEALLKAALGEQSYEWAWFLKQQGKTAEARKVLSDLFDRCATNIFGMRAIYHHDQPTTRLDFIAKALIPLSTPDEKKTIESKLQKVKTHVSNLPDAMIMT